MRDYKKIYDELLQTFMHNNSKIVDMHQQFNILMQYLEQNKPDKQTIYLLEHLYTEADWQYSDFLGEWIVRGFSVSDEQIEVLCSKYAYLEFWEDVFDLMISATDFDRCSLEVHLKIVEDFSISLIIRDIFDYYHKTIIPRKALSELSNTPNQEQEHEPQTPTNPILPHELSTPEAMKYWKKAQEAGLVDDNFQWTGENEAESALFAECFSKALNIRHKWKFFNRLWNISDLAQIRRKTTTEYLLKIDPEREKLIASIFI